MKKIDWKKITLIGSFFIMVGFISFAAGYFILDGMSGGSKGKGVNNPVNNTASAKASGQSEKDRVNENTKIVKIDRYVRGNIHDEPAEVTQAAGELLGKSMDEVKQYFIKERYVLDEQKSTTDEIILIRIIEEKDKWPANCSVVVADESGKIILYQSDESGKLGSAEDLGVNISSLPEQDRVNYSKGYIFNDEDKLAELLEGLE